MSQSDSDSSLPLSLDSTWAKVGLIAIVLLGVVAGAIILSPSDTQTNTQSSSSDSSSNPDSQSQATPTETSSNAVDERKLASAYRSKLLNTTYTVSFKKEIVHPDFKNKIRGTTVTKRGKNAYSVSIGSDGYTVREQWGYGTDVGFQKLKGPSGDSHYLESNAPVRSSRLTQSHVVTGLLESADYVVTGATEFNGESVRVIESSGNVSDKQVSKVLPGRQSVTVDTFDVKMYVGKNDNIVRLVEFSITGKTSNGDEVSMSGKLTVSGVGETSVRKPSWVSKAMSQAVIMNESVKKSSLALTLSNDVSVSKGQQVVAYVDGKRMTARIPEEVSKGDTLYVAVKGGELEASVNEKVSGDVSTDSYTFVKIQNPRSKLPIYRYFLDGSR